MKFTCIKYDSIQIQVWLWLMGWAEVMDGLIAILTLGVMRSSIALDVAIKVSKLRYQLHQKGLTN